MQLDIEKDSPIGLEKCKLEMCNVQRDYVNKITNTKHGLIIGNFQESAALPDLDKRNRHGTLN